MPTQQAKFIHDTIVKGFDCTPRIFFVFDESENNKIDVAKIENVPSERFFVCSTIGLSEHVNWKGQADSGVRLEFFGVMSSEYEDFINLVGTCAFFVMKDKWFVCPDMIFPNVFDLTDLKTDMQHIMFVSPIDFPEQFASITYDDQTIAWLQMIPISDQEYSYAIDHGVDRLKEELEKKLIEPHDLDRKCVFDGV